MFKSRIRLFKLLGFPLSVDFSLFFLAALLTFSLGGGYFPSAAPELSRAAAYGFGFIAALGLFASIVFHELAHAVVARAFRVPVVGITLFIFGGVAEMRDEPRTPKAEFWIAIAGPISSILLAGAFIAFASVIGGEAGGAFSALINYLAVINAMLAVFNLIPAFPLDGGRVLRSVLWWRNGDIVKSTRIAAGLGTVLGFVIIGWGVYSAATGNLIGGLWSILIGFFINSAASQSRAQAELSSTLRGVAARQIMKTDVGAIPADTTLDTAGSYFNRLLRKQLPVVDAQGTLVGTVKLKSFARVPRTQWPTATVASLAEPLGPQGQVSPSDDALETLARMYETGVSELYAVDNGKLAGILTHRDVMDYHAIQLELRSPSAGPAAA